MEMGNEKYKDDANTEPLNKQELEILDSMRSSILKGDEEFAKWERSVGNRVPENTVKFSATIKGELLKHLMFLRFIVCEGYHLMTMKDVSKHIVEFGITELVRRVAASKMQSVIHSKMIQSLPSEMRDAVMTVQMREAIKAYVKAINEGSSLADLLDDKATVVQGKAIPKCEKGICPLCKKSVIDSGKTMLFEGVTCHEDCVLNLYSEKNKKPPKEG